MTTFVFANFFQTTIAAAATSTATSISVASDANVPTIAAGQQWVIVVQSANAPSIREVMYVTATTGTTFTVSRGQEGTTAQAWSVGDNVFAGNTAGQMDALGQLAQTQTWTGTNTFTQQITALGPLSPNGFANMQVFTASGTWTVPPGVTKVRVTVVGGGGGGGGAGATGASQFSLGGGGQGGCSGAGYLSASQIGASAAVIVGAGGAGGVGANSGLSGGASSFGSLISQPGGAGGASQSGSTFASPGTITPSAPSASNCDVTFPGEVPSPATALVLSGGQFLMSARGGASSFGTGAEAVTANNAGVPGAGYGGGGSGAVVGSNSSAETGGYGATGVVIVEW